MNIVKSVIFIACIIGVITSMTDIVTPEGTLKKQLRSVLAVILLLAVITPVMGHGFKVTLSDYTELADLPEFDSVSTATKLYFLDKLNKNGIENVRVDITTDINEYNEIEITAVRVYLTKTSDRGLVEKLIAEDLPDTQVIVQEE